MSESGFGKGLAALFAGLATLPWSRIALALAIFYNLHLIWLLWWDRFWKDWCIDRGYYDEERKLLKFFVRKKKNG